MRLPTSIRRAIYRGEAEDRHATIGELAHAEAWLASLGLGPDYRVGSTGGRLTLALRIRGRDSTGWRLLGFISHRHLRLFRG